PRRVRPVPRGQRLVGLLARSRANLGEHVANAVLHRDIALVGEVTLEPLAQMAALRAEHLVPLPAELLRALLGSFGEPRLDLARRALELVAHEVRVGSRLLALEHARADLEGV